MREIALPNAVAGHRRRWWVLATVVAAQFMYGVDAFIVNVALPTIAVELHASAAETEAVIAVYLIGYAASVITGGRLGDIYGTKPIFIVGVLSFTLTSLWCGLSQSGLELIFARLAQGTTAALMVPQVLATIHVLFSDEARDRAFAIYGIVLGVAAAAGFVFGGLLLTFNVAELGWRLVFFVNIPVGILIAASAAAIVPSAPRRAGTRLDMTGAAFLFLGMLLLIGPLMFGREAGWTAWVWLAMSAGVAVVVGFLRFEHYVARRGGMPLIDLTLLSDAVFMRGLCAVFFFFVSNLSFYLVTTLFLQDSLGYSALESGAAVTPMAVAFVIATRHSMVRAKQRGTRVLTDGCMVQFAGLVAIATVLATAVTPPVWMMAIPLVIYGYGQGLVMAPLSGVVLATVAATSAGSGSGLYGTTTQMANAVGVAAVGAVYFAVRATGSAWLALFIALACIALAIAASIGCLAWMRRAPH